MRKIFMAGVLALSLTACSSTPDPEEVCTSNWVSKRSAKAVSDIYGETEDTVRVLRKIGNRYMEGKSPNIFQLFSLSNKVKGLEKELLRGQGIKDLKILARTCDDPAIVTDGISSFVDKLELPDKMRGFMESLPEYKNMISRHLQDLRN